MALLSNTNVRVFPVICAPRFVRFAITGSLPGSQCPQGMRGQVASVQMYQQKLGKTPKLHGLCHIIIIIFSSNSNWRFVGCIPHWIRRNPWSRGKKAGGIRLTHLSLGGLGGLGAVGLHPTLGFNYSRKMMF